MVRARPGVGNGERERGGKTYRAVSPELLKVDAWSVPLCWNYRYLSGRMDVIGVLVKRATEQYALFCCCRFCWLMDRGPEMQRSEIDFKAPWPSSTGWQKTGTKISSMVEALHPLKDD